MLQLKGLLNKSTKIWINYLLGAAVSALLIWSLYRQVYSQLNHLGAPGFSWAGNTIFLCFALLLMPVNLGLEAYKWKLLADTAQPLNYRKACTSYLAGIAFSIVTPNRIGEYPGRILYLKRKNTLRLISVSVLGAFAQLFAVLFFGVVGLLYYNIAYPGFWEKVLFIVCLACTIGVIYFYLRFEQWAPKLQKIKWFRKFKTYGQLLKRFSTQDQVNILLLSLLRYLIFSAQFMLLLAWMNVSIPLVSGFLMTTLFFWAMAMIPSVALAELGVRGQVGLFLFNHFSPNSIGILIATFSLWAINLVIPALLGSILLFRMRWLR